MALTKISRSLLDTGVSDSSDATAITIDSSENVGIATTSPSQKLEVTGNVYVGGGNYFTQATSGYFFGGSGSFTNGIYGIGTNNIAFNANGSERMRINSSGDVGIGTTAPNVRLYVTGNDAANYLSVFYHDGNDNDRYGIRILTGADSGNGQIWMRFDDGDGHVQGYIQHDSGSVVIGQASDERLKENIVDSTLEGINTLKQIQQREFNFKRDETNTTTVGYVAQELETVYPAAVITNTDTSGEGVVAPDDDPDNPYKFVAKERLIDVLIKATQEQQTIIEDLKARIETLEGGE